MQTDIRHGLDRIIVQLDLAFISEFQQMASIPVGESILGHEYRPSTGSGSDAPVFRFERSNPPDRLTEAQFYELLLDTLSATLS